MKISDKLRKLAKEKKIPLYTTIEITKECNFKCKHCYNYDRSHKNPSPIVLPTEKFLSIIEEVSNEGALTIALTGGEPLLHPDIELLIQKISKCHSSPKLKTNGSLMTLEKLKKLSSLGLQEVEISLYGFDHNTYMNFCGFDPLARIKKILEKRKEFEANIIINIILHRNNCHQLGEMIHFAQSFHVPFNISTEVTKRYDGTDSSLDHSLTEEQFLGLIKGDFKNYFNFKVDQNNFQCACAINVCGISCEGEVYPCIGAPIPSGNLNKKSFHAIWHHSDELNKIRNIKREDFKECFHCPWQNSCDRSSGAVYNNTGNYLGKDPITCQYAKIRFENN